MSEIFIDCEKHRNASQTLKLLANDLINTRTDLFHIAGMIGDAWKGEASDTFLESSEWPAKDIDHLRLDLEELAADIDTTEAAFEEAERRIKGGL